MGGRGGQQGAGVRPYRHGARDDSEDEDMPKFDSDTKALRVPTDYSSLQEAIRSPEVNE